MEDQKKFFNVVVEIPLGNSKVKYEIKGDQGNVYVDRFISTPFFFPTNYGFIPKTLAEDGDPQDVLIITPMPLHIRSIISCRAIGVITMVDEAGIDDKIIAVPTNKITQIYNDINEVKQLDKNLLDQIKYFFTHYKDLDTSKFVQVGGFLSSDAAYELLDASRERFKTRQTREVIAE